MKTMSLATLVAFTLLSFHSSALACRIIDPHPWWPPHHHPPSPPPVSPMQTRTHKADIRIEGNVARVEVSATFHNPNSFQIEGTYFFPIEPDAVVEKFSMKVNGKDQTAELLDSDKARKIYEDIVRRMRDPGLLEYVGTRMLKARVFPIEPCKEVGITLVYQQVVKPDNGLYRFRYPFLSAKPDTGAGPVDQIAVRAVVSSDVPVKLFYSPSHKIDTVRKSATEATGGFELSKSVPDRDFELYWSLDKRDLALSVAPYQPKGEDGYCMISLNPNMFVLRDHVDPPQPKDVVFVFDKSGSMSGDKIKQAKGALTYCLNQIRADDRFSLIAFGTDVDVLTDGLVKVTDDNRAKALAGIQKIEASGGTAIHDALLKACSLLADSKNPRMIVFMTDGQPTVGPGDPNVISAAVKTNNTSQARMFVFGVGDKLNTELLDRLAVENRGTQQYIAEKEDIEEKVSTFFSKMDSPAFSDVTVSCDGVKILDIFPRVMPDIFRGDQLLLFARYRGEGRQTLTVSGKQGSRTRTFKYELDFSGSDANKFIAPVWAHRKVAYLMEQIRINGPKSELRDEIVALGKRYGIVTPYTSFLVAEDIPASDRRAVQEFSGRFERMREGADAVNMSRSVAHAKGAAMAPGTVADSMVGFGGTDEGKLVESAIRRHVRQIGDKVFYRQADGFYYDSSYRESDKDKVLTIKAFSDEYFALLDKHPSIGKYLAAKVNMILRFEDFLYRIQVD